MYGLLSFLFTKHNATCIIEEIKGPLSLDLPTIPAGKVAAAMYHTYGTTFKHQGGKNNGVKSNCRPIQPKFRRVICACMFTLYNAWTMAS